MKNRFVEMFNLNKEQSYCAPPQITNIPSEYLETNEGNIKIFFSYFQGLSKNMRLSATTKLVLKIAKF
jgi:hypothetical protein